MVCKRNGGEKLNKNQSIGVFDSGLGGISVVQTIQRLMPQESIIYMGDSLHAPYGLKTVEEVRKRSQEISELLVKKNVKSIVVACNTATSAAIGLLRESYEIPVIGMEPAIKPALIHSKGRVLVLATEMTLREEKFQKLQQELDNSHRLIKQEATEWVQLVESFYKQPDKLLQGVNQILDQVQAEVDAVVLGCTHFVFLKDFIHSYYKGKVEIFDGNTGTALQLRNELAARNLLQDEGVASKIEMFNTKSNDYVQLSYELLQKDLGLSILRC